MKQKEKVLTKAVVLELGLDKVDVITSDMIAGYTSIACGAFEDCLYLTTITIPDDITSIGSWIFKGCASLTSITLPNSITSISDWMFSGCSSLTSITLPNSVTRIEDWAFRGCSSLASINIPNSVKSIGGYAFSDCSSITSINIPNSVKSIGEFAFYNVPNVKYNGSATGSTLGARSVNGYVDGYLVYADETKTNLLACSAAATGEIIIPNSVTSISYGAFGNCSSLTSITIPNSVMRIEYKAFGNCSSLTSITIPNSVINIGYYVFDGCYKLSNIVIGDKTYKTQTVVNGKCKAYKAFNSDLSCRGFHYEEGKIYEIKDKIRLCIHGFHACLRLTDVFNYYSGEIGKDILVHEVELEDVSVETNEDDSKVVAKKITIGKRIL